MSLPLPLPPLLPSYRRTELYLMGSSKLRSELSPFAICRTSGSVSRLQSSCTNGEGSIGIFVSSPRRFQSARTYSKATKVHVANTEILRLRFRRGTLQVFELVEGREHPSRAGEKVETVGGLVVGFLERSRPTHPTPPPHIKGRGTGNQKHHRKERLVRSGRAQKTVRPVESGWGCNGHLGFTPAKPDALRNKVKSSVLQGLLGPFSAVYSNVVVFSGESRNGTSSGAYEESVWIDTRPPPPLLVLKAFQLSHSSEVTGD
ncbi:predicted protein [Phaeodactylum tricornutum CCAP 1055/1]|uniref:Uncharacterized protein n=3 Tax=Phaeodactylum tricornutum TaxID=2850 RepID=B7GE99_PHATC|nr:predicted protein [Phaeodactylum tricornutum CCAP 1055/1]EEC43117.1 predicted protein [Phaeodactylum tricornutum CCAP 1055/1]|eukprot:XP_002185448.1 predicted protein [Phaeodactylum tricornutum CCAP 1055/1]